MTAVEAIEPVPFIDGIVYSEGPRWHNDRLWFSDGPAGRVCSAGESGDVAVDAEVEHASGLGWLPDGTTANEGHKRVSSQTVDYTAVDTGAKLTNLDPFASA